MSGYDSIRLSNKILAVNKLFTFQNLELKDCPRLCLTWGDKTVAHLFVNLIDVKKLFGQLGNLKKP